MSRVEWDRDRVRMNNDGLGGERERRNSGWVSWSKRRTENMER